MTDLPIVVPSRNMADGRAHLPWKDGMDLAVADLILSGSIPNPNPAKEWPSPEVASRYHDRAIDPRMILFMPESDCAGTQALAGRLVRDQRHGEKNRSDTEDGHHRLQDMDKDGNIQQVQNGGSQQEEEDGASTGSKADAGSWLVVNWDMELEVLWSFA